MKAKAYKIFLLLIFFAVLRAQDADAGGESEGASSDANFNIYKYDPKVKHSLFKEQNSWNRLSVEEVGIPPKKK